MEPTNRSLAQAIWRAQWVTEHLICISSFEDPTDPDDEGLARPRANALRDFLIENSVDPQRIRTEFPDWEGMSGDFARRSEIRLYPKVESLNGDGQILTHQEVRALAVAREITLFPKNEYTEGKRKSLDRYSEEDWMRILGYKSIRDWAINRAQHPLYNCPETSQIQTKQSRPWWKFWGN